MKCLRLLPEGSASLSSPADRVDIYCGIERDSAAENDL